MGALQGLKVLDFTTLLPGPYATMMLADLGAEVLKISGRNRYDLVVHWPPVIEGTDTTASCAWLGRNKKSIYLNMKKPDAVEAVKRLVMEYDIVVEQFRPGVMSRLGIGYEELKTVNPRVIYCAISGYGQDGPMSRRAGHDCNYMARSGVLSAAGRKEEGPSLYNFQIADVAGGSLYAVTGILAAVYHRERTGKGEFVDISMCDGMVPFNSMDGASYLAGAGEPEREGGLLNGGGIYDFYETMDGKYMSVGSLEPQFFASLCEGLGCPEWADGKVMRESPEMVKETFKKLFRNRTRDEWTAVFRKLDACVEPVLSLEEASQDEHLNSRNMWPEVPLPQKPGCSVKQMGCPVHLSETPPEYRHAGYPEGWHTEAVLRDMGYSDNQIAEMSE